MKHAITMFLGLFGGYLAAQPIIQWQKTFGGNNFDEARGICITSDSGYLVVGETASNNGDVFGHHGNFDFWLIKIRMNGSVMWKKILGGTGNDRIRAVKQTSDGGYVLAGYSSSNDYDVSGNHGGLYDGWVVKINNLGQPQWQKVFGGSGYDDFRDVQPTLDNGYILVGRTDSYDGDVTGNHGALDLWVVKINESGQIQWQKTYGGTLNEAGHSIVQTPDGGYIVVGEAASPNGDVSGLHGNIDYWVVKLTFNGALEWQKPLGGNNADIGRRVIISNDENYIISGYVGSHNTGDITSHDELGLFDFWTVKLSQSGEIIWEKALGGTELDYAEDIIADKTGGYVVFGTTQSINGEATGNDGGSDFWIVKLSEDGELVWQKSYGGFMGEEGLAIAQSYDNGFLTTGYTWSTDGDVSGSPNKGKNDYWIVKLSPENFSAVQTPGNPFIQLYPNPARSFINIHVPDAGYTLGVTVNDIAGRTVLQKEITNNSSLDISALPPGIYEAAVDVGGGLRYFAKFEKCMD